MPLGASTGPVLGRCCQHWPSTGPVLVHNGMFQLLIARSEASEVLLATPGDDL